MTTHGSDGAEDPADVGRTPRPAEPAAGPVARAVAAVEMLADIDQVAGRLLAVACELTLEVRGEVTFILLDDVPLERLGDDPEDGVDPALFRQAGYATVTDVLVAGRGELSAIPTVGPEMAERAFATALAMAEARRAILPLELDPVDGTTIATQLVRAVRGVQHARSFAASHQSEAADLVAELRDLLALHDAATGPGPDAARARAVAVERIEAVLERPSTRTLLQAAEAHLASVDVQTEANVLWGDYEARREDYEAVLGEVDTTAVEAEAGRADLSLELVAEIEAFALDTRLLDPGLTLRPYQRFGAAFALLAHRAVLGDEAGLGKDVQALAAMAHLTAAEGARHHVVVTIPVAAARWARLVTGRSALGAHRVPIDDPVPALARWAEEGGVAILDYEAATRIAPPRDVPIALALADECVDLAGGPLPRSWTAQPWVDAAAYRLFTTSAPLDSHAGEIAALVGDLRPDLDLDVRDRDGVIDVDALRRTIASVYLRRRQLDVLRTVPDPIETDLWLDLTGPAEDAYRAAIAAGDVEAARVAAFAPGTVAGSAKVAALVEICDRARAEGLKTLVLSSSAEVLRALVPVLGPRARGPIEVGMDLMARRAVLARVGSELESGVLLADLATVAGGDDALADLSTTSVTVVCEPQWDAALEERAVARGRRATKGRRQQVHRLLTKGIDEEVRRLRPPAIEVDEGPDGRAAEMPEPVARELVEVERRRLGL